MDLEEGSRTGRREAEHEGPDTERRRVLQHFVRDAAEDGRAAGQAPHRMDVQLDGATGASKDLRRERGATSLAMWRPTQVKAGERGKGEGRPPESRPCWPRHCAIFPRQIWRVVMFMGLEHGFRVTVVTTLGQGELAERQEAQDVCELEKHRLSDEALAANVVRRQLELEPRQILKADALIEDRVSEGLQQGGRVELESGECWTCVVQDEAGRERRGDVVERVLLRQSLRLTPFKLVDRLHVADECRHVRVQRQCSCKGVSSSFGDTGILVIAGVVEVDVELGPDARVEQHSSEHEP